MGSGRGSQEDAQGREVERQEYRVCQSREIWVSCRWPRRMAYQYASADNSCNLISGGPVSVVWMVAVRKKKKKTCVIEEKIERRLCCAVLEYLQPFIEKQRGQQCY